ncbi:GNAT family N-acetyltransferase [Alphaproteobacteria bacterium]|nr:GNAT family N-acetyltransferase [Alphaproteobacteria bacterium]
MKTEYAAASPSSPLQVSLRRAQIDDRPQIYRWLAHSDATAEMLGAPTFPDGPIPTWEQHSADFSIEEFYQPGPPQDSQVDWGECWIICVENREDASHHEVGQINFSDMRAPSDPASEGLAELDIWIGARQWWGRGIGTQAIEALGHVLRGYGITTLLIRPSARNRRAVAAYKRAGFIEATSQTRRLPAKVYEPEDWDYADAVVLVKTL